MASPLNTNNKISSASSSCSSSRAVTVLATPLTTPPENPSEGNGCESSVNFCEICVERKESNKMFKIESCLHSFCRECIVKHVAAKIIDGISCVSCPSLNCRSFIEFETCWAMLPKAVAEMWDIALCEALFSEAEKLFCPFKDCSASMILENERSAGEAIRECECPICHRLFCAKCRVPWHPGVTCEEYQRLNEDEKGRDDLLMTELARKMQWRRCPRCKFFVEKAEGCLHITCRCRFEFCYACGATWSPTHGMCRPPLN